MEHVIMSGCDLHEENMLVKIALDRGEPGKRSYKNTESGRRAMARELRRRAKAAGGGRVVFAYEASSQGFGLYDELTEAGFECHVLAPTRIARSSKHRRNKTDEKDAERILELVRGHVLAGNTLPSVWIPDLQTRDDRELVRGRLNLAQKAAGIKAQMQSLLKRHKLRKPSAVESSWTAEHRGWISRLARTEQSLPLGARLALGSLLRQLAYLEQEIEQLDGHIEELSQTERYADPVRALKSLKGVGLLTAMVYLTEMGDLCRFANRKEIGSFLGLVPSSDESGADADRKGHITHQGPARVRRVLCQATWAHVRTDPEAKAAYQRVVSRNPKHKKIAVVAIMRRLAVRMWHIGLAAQRHAGSFAPNVA